MDDDNDVDVTTNPNEIIVSWTNVFTDSSMTDYFEVSLGTEPEGMRNLEIAYNQHEMHHVLF